MQRSPKIISISLLMLLLISVGVGWFINYHQEKSKKEILGVLVLDLDANGFELSVLNQKVMSIGK